MKPMVTLVAAAVVSFAALSSARAEDHWSKTVAFTRSDQTSLRVVEPENYKLSVTIDGNLVADTVPAVIKLPQGDGYFLVTITAPNGAKWSEKVEAKRFQQTELRVKHTPDAPKDAPKDAPTVRKFIGNVTNNVATCGKKLDARFQFVDSAGATVATIDVRPGSFQQASIAKGAYDVRAFVWDKGANDWTFQITAHTEIASDGWKATAMCGTGKLEIRF